MSETETFKTSDLFLVLWLTTEKEHGTIPIVNYERRGRYVIFEFEQNEAFKILHLMYINNIDPLAKFLRNLKVKYEETKDIIYRNEPLTGKE